MTLLAHWPIDDTMNRDSTTARDSAAGGSGSHAGVYTWGTAGRLYPGGVGERHLCCYGGYIGSIGNPSDLQLLGEMTIAAWFWVDLFSTFQDWADGHRRIAFCGVADGGTPLTNNCFLFKSVGRKLHLSWQYGSNTLITVQTIGDVLNSIGPQHIAAVRYDVGGGNFGVKFYINATLVETRDNSGIGYTPPDGGGSAVPYVARDLNVNGKYTFIDSVYIYDEALNNPGIAAIYNTEKVNYEPTISEGPSEGINDIGGPGNPYKLVHNGPFSQRDDTGWVAL